MVNLPKFSKEVWEDNYKAPFEETVEDTWRRLAKGAAKAESIELRNSVEESFYDALSDFKFVPGGRIMANLGVEGREATTLFNCFVLHLGDLKMKDPDSIEGIYEMLKKQAHTLKSEGGKL